MIKKVIKKAISTVLAVTSAAGSVVWGTSCSSASFKPIAEIVNKDGASAVVTFVIDDGNIATADFSKEMMEYYEHLTFTYAIWTKDFATLETTADGSEYVTVNGKYVYTQTEAQKDKQAYWSEILMNGRCEIVSHSHTHSFWGTNDDGGVFEYVKNNETKVSTATMPAGSVTKELYASKQIIADLFPQSRFANQKYVSFISPGIGVRMTDFTTTAGQTIPTYVTYFNQLFNKAIQKNDYIGARGTFQVTNTKDSASKVVLPDSLATKNSRLNIPAYMIVDGNKGNGVENWTAFIDHALAKGGWACYCIHNILASPSGHYIYQDDAEALFAYTADKNIWVATFTEALMYYAQWSTATVNAEYRDGSIFVSVTDKENDDVFDQPMTVKVSVPASWTEVYCDGESLEIHSDSNGGSYVYVTVVPDSGEVEVFQV